MLPLLAALWLTAAPLPAAPQALTSVTSSRALSDGLELRAGEATLRISALRDDILRIRVSPGATAPEDASWAVLREARTQRVKVKALPESEAAVGFRTAALEVRVEKNPLRLLILDLQGNLLSADAVGRPTQFLGGGFQLTKQMPADEHYFGLGDKAGPLDRRDQAFTLWNTDAYRNQESTDPIYKSIPFFMAVRAGRAHGILLDNTWRTHFDFGKQWRDAYSFGAEGGPLEYYFLHGPEPRKVLEGYTFLTGPAPLPPRWALGFQQSRFSYEPESRVREVASRLRADQIPSDVLFLDIDYLDRFRAFTVDKSKFPDLPGLIRDLGQQNFRVITISDMHIAKAPDAGYAPYDTGVAGNHFVHNPDGSLFAGRVWPGDSVFPDFTRAQTRAWWGSLYKELVAQGVAGHWNDMNEPSVFSPLKTLPLDSVHRIEEPGFESRNATHAEVHNVVGLLNARATYEGLLKLQPEERPYVLTRATYAGGHRYGATWTGDNSATWNQLRLSTPMLLNLGLSGFSLSGVDVGGYSGTPPEELLTRWYAVGAFNPLFRSHAEKGTGDHEVWAHGPAPAAVRRRYIETRYRLLPYFYTLAEENSRTGLPMMRPLFLEFPVATEDKHPLDLDAGHEFMLGRALLVAPPPFPENPDVYPVTLPPGDWFDFWTGRKAEGTRSGTAPANASTPSTLKVTPKLDELPVFVRAGSILPLQPLVQHTAQVPQGPLELRVYPGPDCQGDLYLDDGHSLAYKKGAWLRQRFSCQVEANGLKVTLARPTGSYPAWWKSVDIVVHDWPEARTSATLARGGSPSVRYDAATRTLRLSIPADRAGSELRLTRTP
ncbi:Alpha-glucosidase [Cystobacter fuscus DSM 2262]|uniref:Alpha-glucosidase n=1 Tax=Cystobacter fuscus (strain ATCC 25194 / DSM 2262 / NBRC 100088 / M29) TaxID=1242864 RepID=S9Q362_CYSF2|nr:glycoside hydrolase family 31 protein [Cystobacter fuscus]EPX55764.1 Alpha-glucosidase [Cystobacter fuscus DSM 2262]